MQEKETCAQCGKQHRVGFTCAQTAEVQTMLRLAADVSEIFGDDALEAFAAAQRARP